MKKKVEITIQNEKGEITYYQQEVIAGDKQIQIPLKQIILAQQEKVDDNQPIH